MDPLRWLQSSAPAEALRQSIWAYPAVEALHIVGLAVLVGASWMFDLRLLGWAKHVGLSVAARQLLPWARVAFFLLVLPTGLLLFASNATETALNRAFQVKLLLIMAAGVNATIVHIFTLRRLKEYEVDVRLPLLARAHGLISISLWAATIFAGRLIAYV